MCAFVWAALWLVVTGAVPHLAVAERPGLTPFEPGWKEDVVLAVRLNGRGPFRFLLDTGSTHTAVSPATAAQIAAPAVARASMGSAAGSRDTLVVRVDALEVGPVEVTGLLASVVELDELIQGRGIDGVIGHDALASLRYTIDFRQRRVVWWPGQENVARGSSFVLQPSHGRFVVSLPQRLSLLRLVPDTGAESLLLFDPDHTLPVTGLPAPATLKTPSGSTAVRLGLLRELRVGSLTLRDVPAAVAERDESEPSDIDGLLPLHVFDRVTIDGPRQRMIVGQIRADARLMFF